MLVEENGKTYKIDEDTKTVVEAANSRTDLEETVEPIEELQVGDRVEAAGELGKVVLKSASVYGEVLAVRLDSGEHRELLSSDVKKSDEEELDYETPLDEVVSRFEAYKELPMYTKEELDLKAAEARWLNLRAKSLVTDSKLPFSEQTAMDNIVVITGADIMDIREASERLDVADREEELKGTRYDFKTSPGNAPVLGVRDSGGTDWLDDVLDAELTELTDADMAARATEVVGMFSREQLADDDFMQEAGDFQLGYLNAEGEQKEKFASYLNQARQERLSESMPEPKVASADDNLDDFDTSALFR